MAYLAISDPEIANGAIITQTLMHKNRDNLQAICDDDASIPLANTLKRMGRQNAIIIGATDPGGSELLRVGGGARIYSPDTSTVLRVISDTGQIRQRGYADATNGAIIDSVNPASSVYLPLTLQGISLRLFGGGGSGAIVNSSGAVVIGTDPGGAELLRVGGTAKAKIIKAQEVAGSTPSFVLERDTIALWQQSIIANGEYQIIQTTPRLTISTSGAVTMPNGPLVVGNDPGGAELLRVGGDIKTNTRLQITGVGVGGTPSVFLTNNLAVSFPRICFGSSISGTTLGKANANLSVLYTSGASSSGMAIGNIGAQSLTIGTDNTARITIGGTGGVTIAALNSGGTLITTATVVPPSFADLAAVRAWLAAQFT